jgi:hypothetical protein
MGPWGSRAEDSEGNHEKEQQEKPEKMEKC